MLMYSRWKEFANLSQDGGFIGRLVFLLLLRRPLLHLLPVGLLLPIGAFRLKEAEVAVTTWRWCKLAMQSASVFDPSPWRLWPGRRQSGGVPCTLRSRSLWTCRSGCGKARPFLRRAFAWWILCWCSVPWRRNKDRVESTLRGRRPQILKGQRYRKGDGSNNCLSCNAYC